MIGRATTALGITQIVGWGTTYYCTAVLFSVMAADTGWGLSAAEGAISMMIREESRKRPV